MFHPALIRCALVSSCLIATVSVAAAAVILDDTFADGNRTSQNLPTDAAWFVSSAAAVSTSTNGMAWTLAGSAFQAVSFFGTNSASPIQLNLGDTLTVNLKLTLNNVGALNTSQGFRFGVFNFADSTLSPRWATADLASNNGQGTGVQGYALFENMGGQFNNSSPMEIRKRTTIADSGLLGTSGDYTALLNGPGSTNGFSGFTNGGQYSVQLALQRDSATSLIITATLQNLANSAALSISVTDSAATNFRFDGVGLRPSNAANSATNMIFNEVRVDLTGSGVPPAIGTQPNDVSTYVGQTAMFFSDAMGTAPLTYQWFFNTNTLLAGATNTTLTLTNVQLVDAGNYSLIASNAFGLATNDPATLLVTVPTAPGIVTQPQSQTVLPGQSVILLVQAGGAQPLSYQWFFSPNTILTNATDATLTLTNITAADAGNYFVVVSNFIGTATSSNATLTVNTNSQAPVIATQPVSATVLIGGTASFNSSASGTAPIYYQWQKNGTPISGATNPTVTVTNAQLTDAGSFTLVASNRLGTAISAAATLTVSSATALPNSAFNLVGFAQATTGGGVILETDAAYRKVYTPLDFANALLSANKTAGSVKVIEIMNDLDLGINEVGAAVTGLASTPFRAHAVAKLHPRLLTTGVSLIDIQSKSGLTIFSTNGATLRHACLNVKNTANIIIRNLKFAEMWEWDELSKGNYDKNDWDSIDLGNGGTVTNIWIDHCTFTKTYDGQVDIKQGSGGITFSWCKYIGDDGATNPNSWVRQQISSLESNKTSYAMYNFLRSNGFSTEDIIVICQGHDKTHLIGANSLKAENAGHTITFHHDWFVNPWDRLPRLRAGNVHNFNIYVDDTAGLVAKRLRDARAAAMSSANQSTLNNTYNFNPFLNGSISTEGGAVLVEKSYYNGCLTPLRNNQTDPANPVYTGKILALDTIYQMDSTVVRGDSTDAGNPLGPFQAPIIAFSWNVAGGVLPYSYTPDDPSELPTILAAGAGAGLINWPKTNWLRTTYSPTAPTIVTPPQSLLLNASNTATFIVVASGSATLNYRWYFNTNTLLAGATNATLTLLNAQATNVGNYFVSVSNSAGSVTSAVATLTLNNGATGFAAWQNANFSADQLTNNAISGLNATPANDGVKNLVKYALGLLPFVPATNALTSIANTNGAWVLEYQRPTNVSDIIYVPQVSTNLFSWFTNGLVHQPFGAVANGLQTWRVFYDNAGRNTLFYRLQLNY